MLETYFTLFCAVYRTVKLSKKATKKKKKLKILSNNASGLLHCILIFPSLTFCATATAADALPSSRIFFIIFFLFFYFILLQLKSKIQFSIFRLSIFCFHSHKCENLFYSLCIVYALLNQRNERKIEIEFSPK